MGVTPRASSLVLPVFVLHVDVSLSLSPPSEMGSRAHGSVFISVTPSPSLTQVYFGAWHTVGTL